MTYTLITANRNYSSWSLRPWLPMKVLDIPFIDEVVPFERVDNHDAFRRFSPTGLVPVLVEGERTIWDSLGIILYLADRHPGIWPSEPEARAFAQSAVAEMHSGFSALRNRCPMSVGVRIKLHVISPLLERDIARIREIFAEGLSRFGGPWLAGKSFSAIDAIFAPVAFRIRSYGLDVGPGQLWVDHILAHPAMQTWDAAACAEVWRDADHEAEIAATGTLIADHRAT